jgi:hypothetical protein
MQIRNWMALGIGAVMAAAAPAEAQTPSARELVDRHVEAIGGRERILATRSRHLSYEMNVEGTTISMEVWQTRPNLGRSAIMTPMGEITSGTDGTTVYAVSPMGAQVLEGAQAEDVRLRAAFDADLLFDVYPTMETTGRAEHGGRSCWNVRMASEAGVETSRCFDEETGLAIAVTQTQGGMEVTATIDEYREFDGIRYPARTTATAMGQTVVTTLLDVDHTPIDASEFAVPEGVQ